MNLLPKELAYLEQAAKELAKISPDDLNEDVDNAKLVSALRERVKDLSLRDAVSRLTEDHAILKRWLKETKTEEGAVFFIAAYLMRPGPLARQLLAPPPPPEPTVSLETAEGWKAKELPKRLDLFKADVFCSITILDKLGFDIRLQKSNRRQELQKSSQNPWANVGVWSRATVQFGSCHGEKNVCLPPEKKNWKQVEYTLEVPGGFVGVQLGHEKGKDFDEMEFEQKFHTLKILPPKIEISA